MAHDQEALESSTASSQPGEESNAAGAPQETPRGPVRLKSLQSLERLRDRVHAAAQELDRLRKENAALNTRLKQLETRPSAEFDGTVVGFEEDPDALRRQVEGFIEAIDTYLANEQRG